MANLYGPRIVTDGLVLHLDAGNSKSYPRSGTTWYDLSGNGNNGTFGASTAAPTFSGDNGGCLSLDGSNDYFSVNYGKDINPYNSPLSVYVWCKLDATGTEEMIFSTGQSRGNGDINQRLYVGVRQGLYFDYGIRASAWGNTSSSQAANTNWNLITLTIDNVNGAKLYLNKSHLLTKSINNTYVLNDNFNFGTHDADLPFDGKIAIAAIYSKSLSSDEITQNYNALKGRFGL